MSNVIDWSFQFFSLFYSLKIYWLTQTMKYLLVTFTCLWAFCLYSAEYEYIFKNYTANDGLPSTQLYQIIQDNDGYLWIGTDRGLVRYNGYDFKTYTIKDGLSTNVIFKLDLLPNGQISCYGKDRRVYILGKDNRFSPFFWNQGLIDHISNMSNVISYDFTEKGVAFYSTDKEDKSATYMAIGAKGNIIIDQSYDLKLRDDSLGMGISIKYESHTPLASFVYNDRRIRFEKPIYSTPIFITVKKWGEEYLFSLGEKLFHFNPQDTVARLMHEFTSDILISEIGPNNALYLGLKGDGVWRFDPVTYEKECILPDVYCSEIFFDRSKGIWISSLYKGLFYCPDFNVKKLSSAYGTPIQLAQKNNRVFLSFKEKQVYELSNGKLNPLTQVEAGKVCLLREEDHIVFVNRNLVQGKVIDVSRNQYALIRTHIRDRFFHKGQMVIVNRPSLAFMDSCFLLYDIYIFEGFLNTGMTMPNGEILIGTDEGTAIVDKEHAKFSHSAYGNSQYYVTETVRYKPEVPFFQNKMKSFLNIGDSIFVFGSAERGIYINWIGKNNFYLRKEDGLISDAVERLSLSEDNLVVVSSIGASVISLEHGIYNYSLRNGLLSNKVYDLVLCNDSVYCATDMGMTVMPMLQECLEELPIYSTGIKVNGEIHSPEEVYKLRPYEDMLDVYFEGLDPAQEGTIRYKYQLKGVDKTWSETENRSIRYAELPAGHFSFWIAAQRINKSWTKPVKLFEVIKEKPFWLRWEAIIAEVLLFGGLIWGLFYLRFRRQRQYQRDKIKVLNLERKTLQAQMNPHFIFNSLTSLQNLILKDKKEESQEYLGKFARLTRLALNHSTQNLILLSDEIALLDHYIGLERTRFSDNFEFELNVNLPNRNIYVSPMLIQPFVENAILHGLAPKGKGGKLTVEWKPKDKNTLYCIITDNGIGRSTDNVKKQRRSLGIQLVKERLEILLNEEFLTIIDLTQNTKPAGTQVILVLPYKENINESINN